MASPRLRQTLYTQDKEQKPTKEKTHKWKCLRITIHLCFKGTVRKVGGNTVPLGIYIRETQTYSHAKTCTWTSKAPWCVIPKNVRRSKYPSKMDGYTKCLLSIQWIILWPSKHNKVLTGARMNVENLLLSERSKTQRPHSVWFRLYENVQERQRCQGGILGMV